MGVVGYLLIVCVAMIAARLLALETRIRVTEGRARAPR